MAKRGRPKKERPPGWEDRTVWTIHGIDDETKLIVRLYALAHRLTNAEALKELVQIAMWAGAFPLDESNVAPERQHEFEALAVLGSANEVPTMSPGFDERFARVRQEMIERAAAWSEPGWEEQQKKYKEESRAHEQAILERETRKVVERYASKHGISVQEAFKHFLETDPEHAEPMRHLFNQPEE